jgi:fructose-1,6-bisphosphatase I
MKLDLLANDTHEDFAQITPICGRMASEEDGEMTILAHPDKFDGDHYIVFFDPIDGSSNIDVNVSVGTIFSVQPLPSSSESYQRGGIFEKRNRTGGSRLCCVWNRARCLYYTTGEGVHVLRWIPEIVSLCFPMRILEYLTAANMFLLTIQITENGPDTPRSVLWI